MTSAEDLTQSLGRELFTLAQNETQAVIKCSGGYFENILQIMKC